MELTYTNITNRGRLGPCRLIILISLFALMGRLGYGQEIKYTIEEEVAEYKHTSYKAVKSVTLLPGFSFTPNVDGNSFFITIDGSTPPTPALQLSELYKVKTDVIKVPGVTTNAQIDALALKDRVTQIIYYDGFGREVQQVGVQVSPAQKDVVQPIVYDNLGRTSVQYLPYVATSTNGSYQANPLPLQQAFYNNSSSKVAVDAKPYAVSVYDDSPFDALLEQGAPGADWQPGSGHTTLQNTGITAGTENIRIWTENGPTSNTYAASDLVVSQTTGPHDAKIWVYTNDQGQNILKRVWLNEAITENGVTSNVDYLDTYYIYDELGRMRYQVSPKATAKILGGATWDNTFIDTWIFTYTYDAKGRLTNKKVPGSGEVQIVYDNLDRPVLVQDANLRTQNKWYFTKSDITQRPVMTGIYTGSGTLVTQAQLQAHFNSLNYDTPGTYYYEARQSNTAYGYTNQAFPVSGTDILTVNYYDDYDFDLNSSPDVTATVSGVFTFTQGMLTGSKKKVLGSSTWLTSAVFYDKYGRVIETRSNNHLYAGGGLNDKQTITYEGFRAQPKETKLEQHITSSGAAVTVENRLEYDHAERVLEIHQKINSGTEKQLAQYNYNELGQLTEKNLHKKTTGSFLQSVDFRYNIQGWLTRINNSSLTSETDDNGVADVFGLELEYNTLTTGLGATARYDGAIAAVKWKINDAASSSTAPVVQRSYRFTYDKVSRLKHAEFAGLNTTTNAWDVDAGAYDERDINYDHNGNILKLKRYTLNNGSSTRSLIDDLTYSYTSAGGDKLNRVDDAVAGGDQAFKELTQAANEYSYDTNGNLTTDTNKGITLEYNELNKTSRVVISSTKYIRYTYAATGERLKKEVYDAGSLIKTQHYLAGFVYESTTQNPTVALSYFAMAEGRVRHAGGVFTNEYFISDHVGNVRVSFEEGSQGQAVVKQENHYYPFGLAMKGAVNRTVIPTNANKDLLAGGELQDDFDDIPGYYSTFFREYDAVLGRFHAQDPVADKYSSATSYNYVFNNPVNLTDPTGADPFDDNMNPWGQDSDYFDMNGDGMVTAHDKLKMDAMLPHERRQLQLMNESGFYYTGEGDIYDYKNYGGNIANDWIDIDNVLKSESKASKDAQRRVFTAFGMQQAILDEVTYEEAKNGKAYSKIVAHRIANSDDNFAHWMIKDKEGKILFDHWRNGNGKELNFDTEEWGNYMNANDGLTEAIWREIGNRTFKGNVVTGTMHHNFAGHDGRAGGYTTGYRMLGSTNHSVGALQYTAYRTYNGKEINFTVRLKWNDIMDPNYDYITDRFLEKVYPGKPYKISINWIYEFPAYTD